MGVYMLETFLERGKPNEYCYYVKIEELADKYRRETGRQPTIVVDGPNCLRTTLCDRNDQHWILGGQLKEFVEVAKNLVCCFKRIGVDLIFFFGSIVPENKKDTWVQRRNRNIKQVVNLFEYLMNKGDYSRHYFMPPILGAMARFALKYECGCVTEVTSDEHDVTIARYAHELDSFGILSRDTDYIIMDGARHYFSLKHLKLDTMETVVYNGEAFKKALNLEQHELLLLPPLLGCETQPTPSSFHNRICPCGNPKYHDIFILLPEIVKFIKDKNLPNNGNFDYLREIALEVFGTEEKAQDLEMCIRGYIHEPRKNESNGTLESTITSSEREWKEILKMAREKHESCDVTAHLYPVMLGHEYELSVALENYSKSDFVSTAETFLSLRQRIYGILLYEKPDAAPFVKELCIQGMRCPTEASEVAIKWITDIEKFHPGLRKLWNKDCCSDKRWNLFVQSLTEKNKLNAAGLKQLGFPYAVPVAVLYFLVQEGKEMLKEVEIDVILAQAALVRVYTADDIKAMSNQLISGHAFIPRVVELSTIFLRGVTMVSFLLAACGFPLQEAMPWLYFDGKLFHQKYIQAVKERKGPRELCEDTSKAMDVYSTYRQMKNLVMPMKSWR